MNDVRRGIGMLLDIKKAALEAELGDNMERVLFKAAGCGMFVIASYIDEIIQTINKTQTELADYKHRLKLATGVEKQWQDLGFPENPEDMDKETLFALKSIALEVYGNEEDEEDKEKT